MKKFLKNYRSTLILLLGIIIGVVVGLVFKEKAKVLSPLGDLFINMMFMIIVPLIFLTITTSISKIDSKKRLGKIMTSIVGVFIFTSFVAVIIGFLVTFKTKLVNPNDVDTIKAAFTDTIPEEEDLTILDRTVDVLTVTDFQDLLSRDNLIALIVFSIMFGIALSMTKKTSEPVIKVLESLNNVIMTIIKLIMYYAPIGLGCYIASLVGTFGSEIAIGYLKTFVLYTVVAILYYVIVYSIYALVASGKKGLISYWKNIIPATVTSIATCSSAASIPVNVTCTKNIGVPDDIAETMIPLGTSFHKDGSIIGSMFKIMFLVCLFGTDITSAGAIFKVLGVALIANLLITAVPIGGGTISEMMIITLMGYSPACLPILTIIATIIDPPATCLNVVGDSASSMLTARIVDGKNWLKKKVS